MKNWNFYQWALAMTLAAIVIAIAYGLYTDTPGTAIYVPNENAIRF